MKLLKTLSIVLTLCLTFSMFVIVNADENQTVVAKLSADKATVKEGGTVKVSFSISGLGDAQVTGGQIALDVSGEDYSNIFSFSEQPTWAEEGIIGTKSEPSEDYALAYSFTAAPAITFADDTVIFTISLAIKADALGEFDLTIDTANTYITTNDETSVETTYGVTSDSTTTINIKAPCDINNNGKIDFLDFHFLCSYINKNYDVTTCPQGDLNGDGSINRDDVTYLVAGYMAQEGIK